MPTDACLNLDDFFSANDFSKATRRAIKSDLAKFARWFQTANNEPLKPERITVRDVADFRDHLSRVRRQAVSTINRSLVSIRRFLSHLVACGELPANPAASVKELRRQPTVPQGLNASDVRKIMREVEIRQDKRAGSIIGLMLFGGLRVSDVVGLETDDVMLNSRSGQVICRRGKGNKQRTVPLSIEARRLLSGYLEIRPPVDHKVFIGERGPLTDDGVRAICNKYSAITGIRFSPHKLRHTFAHRFLSQTSNDLISLAQILGHESLNTTAIYTKRTQDDLQSSIDNLRYE